MIPWGGGESSESSQSSSSDSINPLVLASIENPSDYSIKVNGDQCDPYDETFPQWRGALYDVRYLSSTSSWEIYDMVRGTFMWLCDQVDCTKPNVWKRTANNVTWETDSTMSVSIVSSSPITD